MNLFVKVLAIVALLAPQVIVSVFAIVFFIAVIQSLDCLCSQFRDYLIEVIRSSGPLRLPSNFCSIGLLVALACAGAGLVWRINPEATLAVSFQSLLLVLSMVTHLLCLSVLLASIAAINEFVDPSA